MAADRAGSAANPPDLVAEAVLGCSLAPAEGAFSIEVLAANGGPVSLTLPGEALHHVLLSLLGLVGRLRAQRQGGAPVLLSVVRAAREALPRSGRELLTLTTTTGAELSFLLPADALAAAGADDQRTGAVH